MQRKQNADFIKFFWFTNGVEKLIVMTILTIATGIFFFSLKKETMDVLGIVAMELAIVIVGASLMGLYYYNSYSSYLQFVSGTKIKVAGGQNFLKNLSQAFWDGESKAAISFGIELPKEEGPEIRKAVTEFLSNFVIKGNEKFRSTYSIRGWEVSTEVTLGKASNFFLSELTTNLMDIHSKFPAANISLSLTTTRETIIESQANESSDETWAEARWRHQQEQKSHDDDFGSDHGHRH